MRRHHILFLEALPTIAGGQRVLLDLLPALCAEFDVTVAIPGPGPLAEALSELRVATTALPIQRFSLIRKTLKDVLAFAASTPRLSMTLRSLIRRTHVDLVYANSAPTFPWGTLGAALAGKPVVWHSHNNLGDGKSLLLARALAGLPSVHRIIGAAASAIDQFGQPGKSLVIRSGVDLARFAPSAEKRAQCRGALNIPESQPLIGILGDFIPLKRQDDFLRAAQQVQAQYPIARFAVVGAVRPTPESQAYYQSLAPLLAQTNALALPWPDDLTALLNALDAVTIASTMETGPLVLFQGLACGVPVISTPVGHAPDLLRESDAGSLFPVGDDAALCQLMLRLLRHPERRHAIQTAARKLAEEQLDLRRTQQKVIGLLADVLAQTSSHPGVH
ncbi:MAG: glycosyltransferase [Chloroflexi bacterium]|nr:glycosyltransferase [Chloroflexota bacterium]